MDIKGKKEKIVMKLSFKETNLDGKEKNTSKSYANIRELAEDGAIYSVGKLLSKLQTKELNQICKIETTVLEEA